MDDETKRKIDELYEEYAAEDPWYYNAAWIAFFVVAAAFYKFL